MLIVTGSLHARPDTLDELLRLAREHVTRSRLEPGCLEHRVAVDADEPLRLVFLERWSDPETLRAHLALPASRGFGRATGALVARPPTLSIYEAVDVRDQVLPKMAS